MGSGRAKTVTVTPERLYALISPPNSVFYTTGGTEVIVNPTVSQYRQLDKEFKKDNPNLVGEPSTRTTYDIDGNTYIWRSDANTHYFVENFIDRTFGTLTHQNKYFDIKYDEEVIAKRQKTIDKLTIAELNDYNADKKEYYRASLLLNETLKERGKIIIDEVRQYPRDYASLKANIDSFSVDTGIREGVYREYSSRHGDIKLKINTDAGLTETEWNNVYESYGGKVMYPYRGIEAYNRLMDYLSNRVKYSNYPKEFFGEKVFNKLLINASGSLDTDVIKKAFKNMTEGTSPYTANDKAQGAVLWDEENSPTTRHNSVIAGRMNYSVKILKELTTTFKSAFPDLDPLRGAFFSPPLEEEPTALAFYTPSNHRIGITTKLLSDEYDKDYSNPNYFIVAGVSRFPLLDSIVHEYGHAIHYDMMRKKYAIPKIQSAFGRHGAVFEFTGENDQQAHKVLSGGKVEVLEAISPYGNMNKREAFSEAFSLYATGAEPTMGVEYYSKFKTLMKDLGLEAFKGMYQKVSIPEAPTLKTPVKTVQSATLDKTPDAQVLSFSVGGKSFKKTLSNSAKERGYFTKRANGYEYTIDSKTGSVLKKRLVNKK